MIRISSYNKYEEIVKLEFQRFFNEIINKALDPTDLLVCHQGGFFEWSGNPCIGLGEVGLNNLQKYNYIQNIGKEITVNEDDYFKKYGNSFFNGITDFEKGIIKVNNLYLDIWENEWFLRNFAEVVRIANGLHYDWNLDLSNLSSLNKSNFIREEIIKKLDKYPYFQGIIREGYNNNFRNAIAHSQYHLVQGGICLDNFGRDKYAITQFLSFDEWEKLVIYAWSILRFIYRCLNQLATFQFFYLSKIMSSRGIPILVPINGEWQHRFIYPDKTGRTWRFIK